MCTETTPKKNKERMNGPSKSSHHSNASDNEEQINKENATPGDITSSSYETASSRYPSEVRIRVGGMNFLLDYETIQKLNSELINQSLFETSDIGAPRTSPSRQQQRQQYASSTAASPRKGFCEESSNSASNQLSLIVDEGDAECFSALVHMARFGSLPTSIFSKEKRDLLLDQAEQIWNVRPLVEEGLNRARAEFRKTCDCADAIRQCLLKAPHSSLSPYEVTPQPFVPAAVASLNPRANSYAFVPPGGAVSLGGPHHNYRRDDGSRRVFCSACGHRDIDWRYHIGDFYSNCQKCHKDIFYKPDLGWCHKCRQCEDCQTSQCPGVPIRQLEEQVIPFLISLVKENESEITFF